MNFLNSMATQVTSEIRQLQAQSSLPYLEARLHITYELSEYAHQAHLSLYTLEYDGSPDNIFRGDTPDDEVELDFSPYRGENKRFIAALSDALSPDFCYLSEQVHLDFNREGAKDVSDRFAFKDLLAALATVETAPDDSIMEVVASPTEPLAVRTAKLEALLQAYHNGLDENADTTIYFMCDIDEDESSAEQQVYAYTDFCVLDANFKLISKLDEKLFDACCPDESVSDILTIIAEVPVEEWLRNRGILGKKLDVAVSA